MLSTFTHPQPTTMIRLAIGAQVVHAGHGPGVVVEYNTTRGGFYSGTRYPYVIEFANGFKEVYSNIGIKPAPALPAPKWVSCYNKCLSGESTCFPWTEDVCGKCSAYINLCKSIARPATEAEKKALSDKIRGFSL